MKATLEPKMLTPFDIAKAALTKLADPQHVWFDLGSTGVVGEARAALEAIAEAQAFEGDCLPPRPDLAIGALTVALATTTDLEAKPWLRTAMDFLQGTYEPLDESEEVAP